MEHRLWGGYNKFEDPKSKNPWNLLWKRMG